MVLYKNDENDSNIWNHFNAIQGSSRNGFVIALWTSCKFLKKTFWQEIETENLLQTWMESAQNDSQVVHPVAFYATMGSIMVVKWSTIVPRPRD